MDFHVSVTFGILGRVCFNDWFRDNFGTRELQVQTCLTTEKHDWGQDRFGDVSKMSIEYPP